MSEHSYPSDGSIPSFSRKGFIYPKKTSEKNVSKKESLVIEKIFATEELFNLKSINISDVVRSVVLSKKPTITDLLEYAGTRVSKEYVDSGLLVSKKPSRVEDDLPF